MSLHLSRWCPVLPVVTSQRMAQIWLTFVYFTWMVKHTCWGSVLPVLVGKCTIWSPSSTSNFHEKVGNLHCITVTHSWYCTKHWENKALGSRLQHSPALLFLAGGFHSYCLSPIKWGTWFAMTTIRSASGPWNTQKNLGPKMKRSKNGGKGLRDYAFLHNQVPTDLHAAWSSLRGLPVPDGILPLEGVTRISVAAATTTRFLRNLPQSLRHLTIGDASNAGSIHGVKLPSSLESLTFGRQFNESLEGIIMPSSLQSLTFGRQFTRSLEGVILPNSLQNLTFGYCFNRSLEGVILPGSLQNLTFGYMFNRSLEGVTLPNDLKSLTFGYDFNYSLQGVALPAIFKALHLVVSSAKTWTEWPCQAIFRPWHLARVSTAAWKEWPYQAVLRVWHLVALSTRA